MHWLIRAFEPVQHECHAELSVERPAEALSPDVSGRHHCAGCQPAGTAGAMDCTV